MSLLHFPFFQIAKVASYLKKVRQEIVPHLVNFSVEAMNNSAPIIRPLWMLDPHDPINQVIDDEFLIGDKVNIICTSFIANRTEVISEKAKKVNFRGFFSELILGGSITREAEVIKIWVFKGKSKTVL